VILGYLLGLVGLALLVNVWFGTSQWLFADRVRAQFTGFLLVTLPVSLYFALGESSARQATWGKGRLGLKVTNAEGGRISLWRALARTALKFLPWELAHTLIWAIYFSPQTDSIWISYGFVLVYGLIGLNLASLLVSKKHQTIYDLLTRTSVMRQAR
jgi:uncharacterized RDD family membrane protein YckC